MSLEQYLREIDLARETEEKRLKKEKREDIMEEIKEFFTSYFGPELYMKIAGVASIPALYLSVKSYKIVEKIKEAVTSEQLSHLMDKYNFFFSGNNLEKYLMENLDKIGNSQIQQTIFDLIKEQLASNTLKYALLLGICGATLSAFSLQPILSKVRDIKRVHKIYNESIKSLHKYTEESKEILPRVHNVNETAGEVLARITINTIEKGYYDIVGITYIREIKSLGEEELAKIILKNYNFPDKILNKETIIDLI